MSTYNWPGSVSSNPSVGPNGSTAPIESTEIGFIDGSGNLQPVSAENPLPVDVTLTLPDPLPVSDATTHTELTAGNASLASIDGKTPALGQALEASSVPVVLPADQITALTPPTTVTANQGAAGGSAWPVSMTSVPLAMGAATAANQATEITALDTIATNSGTQATAANQTAEQILIGALTETAPATDTASSGLNGRLQRVAQRLTSLIALLPTTLGQKVMAGSFAVTIASDQSAVPVSQSGTWTVQPGNTANTTPWLTKESVSATSAVTSVASSASSVSLLASNSARLGATFYNDSMAILYLKLGATASTTSYTVQMAAGSYYELPTPHLYTGAIDGIWASANGNVRITELS